MDRDEVEVHKNAKKKKKKKKKKKERGQYPAAILIEQAWLIKDLLFVQKITPSISFNVSMNASARGFHNQPKSKLLFVYLTLSESCNQCFLNCVTLLC